MVQPLPFLVFRLLAVVEVVRISEVRGVTVVPAAVAVLQPTTLAVVERDRVLPAKAMAAAHLALEQTTEKVAEAVRRRPARLVKLEAVEVTA